MAAKWIETLTGSLEQKKQYKQDKARIDALPEPYGTAAKAMQRYFMYYGGITDGDTLITMFGDLADLWERAAADGTPVREIVGDDPVEFAETFAQAYTGTAVDRQGARPPRPRRSTDAEREERRTMTIDQLEPAIRVQGIEKSFKDLHVLRGVDFDVQAGSIFALLGSNGAGKTTLVRILSTLLKAGRGHRHGRTASTSPRNPATCASRSA